MPKVAYFFASFLLLIIPNLDLVLADAPKCDSNFGTTYTVIPPPPLPVGITDLKIKFDGGLTDGYYYRLRFADITWFDPSDTSILLGNHIKTKRLTTDYVRATDNSVTIPVTNESDTDIKNALTKGKKVSTLEFSTDGQTTSSERCGFVEYEIGKAYTFGDCRLTYIPANPTERDDIDITIRNSPQGTYPLMIGSFEAGSISINSSGTGFFTLLKTSHPPLGKSPIDLYENDPRAPIHFCSNEITIKAADTTTAPTPSCDLHLPALSGEPVKIKAVNLITNSLYQAFLDGAESGSQSTGTQTSVEIPLIGTLSPGNHSASLKDSNNLVVCPEQTFSISTSGEVTTVENGITTTITPCKPTATPGFTKGDTPCTSSSGINCETDGITTAIGCVHTEPIALIKDVLKFLIGIAGGIAFLLMLLGAFGMITSAGNPDALKEGQDRFVKAIEGLLFVIFAVLLLKVIGVDILGLGNFFK